MSNKEIRERLDGFFSMVGSSANEVFEAVHASERDGKKPEAVLIPAMTLFGLPVKFAALKPGEKFSIEVAK